MDINGVALLVAFFASVSTAAERFVVIVKLIWPRLADPNDTVRVEYEKNKPTNKVLPENLRRFLIHLASFLGGWLAAAAWADNGFHLFGPVTLKINTGAFVMCPLVAGIFGVAGSAFWSSVVGYVTAAKDVKKEAAT
jgi:hypothetical protein